MRCRFIFRPERARSRKKNTERLSVVMLIQLLPFDGRVPNNIGFITCRIFGIPAGVYFRGRLPPPPSGGRGAGGPVGPAGPNSFRKNC